MAIKYSIEQHHVAFPSKVLSGQNGRILNIALTEDTDNGTIVGKGAYVSFDQYKNAACPSTYEGRILEKAADKNWYVEVTKVDINNPAILIYSVPEITETYNYSFKKTSNFYNKKGSIARGYVLTTTDVYELSEDAFTGTPVAGAKVTVSGQKHVVSSTSV